MGHPKFIRLQPLPTPLCVHGPGHLAKAPISFMLKEHQKHILRSCVKVHHLETTLPDQPAQPTTDKARDSRKQHDEDDEQDDGASNTNQKPRRPATATTTMTSSTARTNSSLQRPPPDDTPPAVTTSKQKPKQPFKRGKLHGRIDELRKGIFEFRDEESGALVWVLMKKKRKSEGGRKQPPNQFLAIDARGNEIWSVEVKRGIGNGNDDLSTSHPFSFRFYPSFVPVSRTP